VATQKTKTTTKAKAKRRKDEGIVDQIDRELEEERHRLAAKDARLRDAARALLAERFDRILPEYLKQ